MSESISISACAPAEVERSSFISVCHVISGGIWGGAEAYVAALLRTLSRFQGLTLSAILLKEDRLAQVLRSYGVDVTVLAARGQTVLKCMRSAATFLRQRQVRILHSHRYKENLIAALLARYCDIPVLVRTEHGRYDCTSLKRGIVLTMDSMVGKCAADRIISVSTDLIRSLGHFDARKIVVIRNGIDVNQIQSHYTPMLARERLGIPSDALVVGAAARLVPVKRLDLFLAAAAHIALALPKAYFLIAGSGPEEGNLARLVAGPSLETRVKFLRDRDDIYDVLRALDLLLMTSDHEGVPMVLLEAMALQLPVVARRVGGIPEIVQDGVTGRLVDSADPIAIAKACIEVLADPALGKSLGKAARESVWRNHSAEQNARQVVHLYRSLLGYEQ
jgi:glycosyltransferase involved in cell wall biosynthesis